MLAPSTFRAGPVNADHSLPQTIGSHSLGGTRSGPIAIPVRNPSSQEIYAEHFGPSSGSVAILKAIAPVGGRLSLIRSGSPSKSSPRPGRHNGVPRRAPGEDHRVWGGNVVGEGRPVASGDTAQRRPRRGWAHPARVEPSPPTP